MTAGVVEIVDLNGALVGTGFVAGGHVITCHHVAYGKSIAVRDAAGSAVPATLVEDDELRRSDLALLAIDTLDGALAIEPAALVPAELLLRGFGMWGRGYRGSVPVRATVAGPTSITYSKDTCTYQLDGVWKLDRADVTPGFSGGPAIDEHGVAVGVTIAQLASRSTAFVIPFARVATAARFVALLEDNRARVPRSNAHADARTTLAVLARQCAGALTWLRELRMFLDEWSVVRMEEFSIGVRFLAGTAQLLPVIGPSGTGKTFMLAQLASSTALPSLLLLARDVKPSSDLENEVIDAISANKADAARCLQHLRRRRWVIFLDGLNELRLPIEQIRTWLLRAVRWARGTGAALVVSCRTEFWRVLDSSVQESWCDRVETTIGDGTIQVRKQVLSLGAFTLEEATQARRRYRLTIGWAELREPALLRVAAELVERARTTRWDVIDAFLRQRCEAVARAINLTRSPPAILSMLEDFAVCCLESIDRVSASAAVAESAVGGDYALLQMLIGEGLLVRSDRDRTIRFAFDWIAEHLQGKRVDLGAALAAYNRDEPTTASLLCAGLEHAIHVGETDAVTRTLDTLVKRVRRDDTEVVAVLRALSSSFDLVKRVLTTLFQEERCFHLHDDVYHFVASAPFPVAQRLELARELVPQTHYWPWRSKDRDYHVEGFSSGCHGLFELFRTLLQEDTVTTVSHLIPWLGDDTVMWGNEGSVDEVATAAMLWAHTLAHEAVADRLSLEWPRTRLVLEELSDSVPKLVAGDLRRWNAETNRARHAAVEVLLDRLLRRLRRAESDLVDADFVDAVIDVATEVFRRTGNESLAVQAVVQGRDGDDLWCACAHGTREGRIPASEVVPLLASHFDEVIQWLEEAAKRSARNLHDVTWALGRVQFSNTGLERLTAFLSRWREVEPYGAALAVEYRLRRTAPATATSVGLWSLAVDLVDAGDNPRSCMMFFAYGVPVTNVAALQEKMARLIAAKADEKRLIALFEHASSHDNPCAFVVLDECLHRNAACSSRLIAEACARAKDRSSPIVTWARQNAASIPAVARWLAAVEAGEPPGPLALRELRGLYETMSSKGCDDGG